jgi:hypothetical protein
MARFERAESAPLARSYKYLLLRKSPLALNSLRNHWEESATAIDPLSKPDREAEQRRAMVSSRFSLSTQCHANNNGKLLACIILGR